MPGRLARQSRSCLDRIAILALFQREANMLYYAAVFFVIAIIAAVLGFGGIAAGAASIAKILFFVFLVLALLSIIGGMFRR
jgi:uncharacterized membrane protein YtjA (UPF0391 family)